MSGHKDPLLALRDDVLDLMKAHADEDPIAAASVLFAAGSTILAAAVGQPNALRLMRTIVNEAANRMHN